MRRAHRFKRAVGAEVAIVMAKITNGCEGLEQIIDKDLQERAERMQVELDQNNVSSGIICRQELDNDHFHQKEVKQ